MAQITDQFIEQVKNSLDLVELASEYLELERSGKNYRALCPFHQEDTPSFTINPREQFFYCFGCGEGGDIISFVMNMDNLSFREALMTLTERAGMEMPAASERDRARMKLREEVFSANRLAARFYNYLLLEDEAGEEARNYLIDRGIDRSDMEKFQLGFAPSNWQALTKFLCNRDYEIGTLIKAGLTAEGRNGSYYDRFRNRVIFPIFNVRDEVLGFGGRVLSPEDEPKYLNSPETVIFSKKHVLYGLTWARDEMRNTDEAVVVEGYTDVLAGHKAGLKNFVAALGTSFTEQQAELLNRYAERVYIAFDADSAGERATLRGLEILRQTGVEVNIIRLPLDEDPDDFIRKRGEQAFLDLQDKAPSLIDYRLDGVLEEFDIDSPEGRIRAVQEAAEFLASLEDPLTREVYSQKLADTVNMSEENIEELLNKKKLEREKEEEKQKRRRRQRNERAEEDSSSQDIDELQWQLLAGIMNNRDMQPELLEKLRRGYFSGAEDVFMLMQDNPEMSVAEIFSRLEGGEKDRLAAYLMDEDRDKISPSRLRDLCTQLARSFAREEIERADSLLREEDFTLSIDRLNDIVIYYRRLLELERGGEQDG